MRGSVFRQCWCRDPETGRPLHRRCPKLRQKAHGQWYFRYEAPRAPQEPRRQPVAGPFATKKEAEEELAATLARLGGGGSAPDRSLRLGAYLDAYIAGKINLKPRSWAADKEAIELYWKPALGHLRLVDLRDHHVSEAIREILKINRPLPDGERPSEMLRRLIEARADDERRELPPGEQRRKKSSKPLSPARIRRVFAPLRAAMNAAVPSRIAVSPCDGVTLPRARKVRPLEWTGEREAAFWSALERRMTGASAERRLTAAEKQEMWGDPVSAPVPGDGVDACPHGRLP